MIDYSLYIITIDLPESKRTHIDIARETILGGATIVQLREKTGSTRKILETAYEIRKLTQKAKIPFIINDRLDIAMAVNSDGVHLGQEDMPLNIARKILGKDRVIGISATNLEEAIEAESQGADYLGVGPIFATPSKEDAAEPMGLGGLAEIRKKVKIPIVAIGGISWENMGEVIRAGADGVAVISAIAGAPDMKKATSDLLKCVNQYLKG
jgi:thiamine-phosphate pyrophosphorylase